MKKKLGAYWWCQIGGWTFYSLAYMFLAFVFDQKISGLFAQRLGLSVLLGFLITDVFRITIHRFKMFPPLSGSQWIKLFLIVAIVCVTYSLIYSSFVEWFQLYDPNMKTTVQKRFIFDLFYDAPIIISWVAIYYVWHYIEANRRGNLDKVRLESLVKELELKTIKAHINPHFIFNALNSIRALVDENPARARTAITALSNILRSSMKAEKLETSSLEKELSIVKDYLDLEHVRFEDRLNVEYHIEEDTLDQQIPPMMLQTLVENAIKHGISKQVNGGIISVISTYSNEHHELIVRNTGQLSETTTTEGFGIPSTQNRLKLLFGKKALFHIKNYNDEMVEAKVILPLNTSLISLETNNYHEY